MELKSSRTEDSESKSVQEIKPSRSASLARDNNHTKPRGTAWVNVKNKDEQMNTMLAAKHSRENASNSLSILIWLVQIA
jgi:hypothetical protein